MLTFANIIRMLKVKKFPPMKKLDYIMPLLRVEDITVEAGFGTSPWVDKDGEIELNSISPSYSGYSDWETYE